MSGFGQASPFQEPQGSCMWSLCLGQLEFPPNLVSSGQLGCYRVAEASRVSVPANKAETAAPFLASSQKPHNVTSP